MTSSSGKQTMHEGVGRYFSNVLEISTSSSRNLHSRQHHFNKPQGHNIKVIRNLKTSESARMFRRKDRLLSNSRIRSFI